MYQNIYMYCDRFLWKVNADVLTQNSRKGELKPISVIVKLRQGRKACTLITNFESFLLDADALADELQKLCASSTTGT